MAAGAYPANWSQRSALTATGRPFLGWKWATLCTLSILPFAAILHHAVFYPAQCMINFFGTEYSLAVVKLWLTRDPSLLGAALIAIALYRVGLDRPRVRSFVPAFLLAFLPLTIWIWDVPFAGRWVCQNFHDLQVTLPGDVPLRSRHLYMVGAVLFPAVYLLLRNRSFSWPASAPAAAAKSLRSQEA